MASADKLRPFSAPEGTYSSSYVRTRKMVFLALLTSLALVLHLVELALPNPTPWLRLGLANIITLTVLVIYGLGEGLIVGLVRIFLGSLISGQLFGPAFILSISGGTMSILAMWASYMIAGKYFSLIGLSLIGAYVHTLTQLGVAYMVLIQHREVFSLLPIFLTVALVSGFLNGLGATVLTRHLATLR